MKILTTKKHILEIKWAFRWPWFIKSVNFVFPGCPDDHICPDDICHYTKQRSYTLVLGIVAICWHKFNSLTKKCGWSEIGIDRELLNKHRSGISALGPEV